MATYDKYYKEEDYFKGACPELISFFVDYPERGSLCDLGAGQGRDSLPLAKSGYAVTAVDISKVGLEQIKTCNPKINIELSDIYTYDVAPFDFILMDSMLHFYKKDIEKESNLVRFILKQMKKGSIFANNMIKSKKAEKIFKSIVTSSKLDFEMLEDKYIDYPDYDAIYHFMVLQKK